MIPCKRNILTIYILGFTMLFSGNLLSQIKDEPLITCEKGLTNNILWGQKPMIKDDIGRYWIATFDGLNIFDGYAIKQLRVENNDPHSITNNALTTIEKGENGDIWIGTANDGLMKYDNKLESFSKIDLSGMKPANTEFIQINGIGIDDEGKVWIAQPFKGIFIYDEVNSTLHKLSFGVELDSLLKNHYSIINIGNGKMCVQAQNSLFIGNEKSGFEQFEFPISQKFHNRLTIMPNGNIIVLATHNKGIYYLDRRSKKYEIIDENINIWGISECIDDEFYFTGDDGLYNYNYKNKELEYISDKIKYLNGGLKDDHNNLLVFSEQDELCRIETNRRYFQIVSGTMTNNVKSGNNGDIIFASENSLYSFNPNTVITEKLITLGKQEDFIGNFAIYPDGKILINQYINADQGFLNILVDQNQKILESSSPARGYEVMNPLADKIGINTEIYKDLPAGHNLVYPGDIIENITGQPYHFFVINNFIELKNGELWVARFNNGMDIVNASHDSVKTILPSRDNNYFLGNNIKHFFESQSGNIYIQTEIGLNEYNPKTKKSILINKKLGLERYTIFKIGEDLKGKIWILTNVFLYRWDPLLQNLSQYRPPRNYIADMTDEKDMVGDFDGYLYFGNNEGLVRFHPDSLTSSLSNQKVFITDLFIDRRRVYPQDEYDILDSSIVLQDDFNITYDQRDVGFSFVAVDGHLDNLTYYYRLKGYKDTWQKADVSRTIHFTNLQEGNYIFEVKTKNGSGVWLPMVDQKHFTVSPPWVRTYWAYSFYSLLMFCLGYGVYRYRLAQLNRYQVLRTKISSDLHDDVGTILSSVAMQSEVLGLNAPPEKAARFDKLSALSREAMGRMRDTVWAIDSRKDNVDSLIDRMQDYLSDMGSNEKFRITFHHKASKLTSKLPPDVRQNVYLIFKEAVNNAFKYSIGDQLNIQFSHSSKKGIQLIIKDNGKVETENLTTSGTGISNMKMRAERIGGNLEINTQEGFSVDLKV